MKGTFCRASAAALCPVSPVAHTWSGTFKNPLRYHRHTWPWQRNGMPPGCRMTPPAYVKGAIGASNIQKSRPLYRYPADGGKKVRAPKKIPSEGGM